MTIKNKYPLTRTNDLMDQLVDAHVFCKIDLRSGYYHILVKPEDISNAMFRMRYSHCEDFVMSFDVSKASGMFMEYVNRISHPCLDQFVVVFIDDILVYCI